MKRCMIVLPIVAAIAAAGGFWLGRSSSDVDHAGAIRELNPIESSELRHEELERYVQFGLWLMWDDPDDQSHYGNLSIVPHNIIEFHQEIAELPEYKRPKEGSAWIIYFDVSPKASYGVFLGLQVEDRLGRTRRYMNTFDREPLEFVREVLRKEAAKQGEIRRPGQEAEQAGADQPATKPADRPSVKDQPSTPTPKGGPR